MRGTSRTSAVNRAGPDHTHSLTPEGQLSTPVAGVPQGVSSSLSMLDTSVLLLQGLYHNGECRNRTGGPVSPEGESLVPRPEPPLQTVLRLWLGTIPAQLPFEDVNDRAPAGTLVSCLESSEIARVHHSRTGTPSRVTVIRASGWHPENRGERDADPVEYRSRTLPDSRIGSRATCGTSPCSRGNVQHCGVTSLVCTSF